MYLITVAEVELQDENLSRNCKWRVKGSTFAGILKVGQSSKPSGMKLSVSLVGVSIVKDLRDHSSREKIKLMLKGFVSFVYLRQRQSSPTGKH